MRKNFITIFFYQVFYVMFIIRMLSNNKPHIDELYNFIIITY